MCGEVNLKIVAELRRIINAQPTLVAWVGSGLSGVAAYPEWPLTIRRLCAATGVPPLADDCEPSPEELMNKADECKRCNRRVYHAELGNLFGHRPVVTREGYQDLAQMRFSGYVTTNFDPLLLCACERQADELDLQCFPDLNVSALRGTSKAVCYIHGLAWRNGRPDGSNLVLSATEFARAYGKRTTLESFLRQLFRFYPILFLGCTLREPALEKLFECVQKMRLGSDSSGQESRLPDRFILRPFFYEPPREGAVEQKRDYDAERDEDQRMKDLGITMLRYDPIDDEHSGIEEILASVRKLETPRKIEIEGEDLGQDVL